MYSLALALVLPSSFTDTPTPDIYTLSLHDALPISPPRCPRRGPARASPGSTTRSRRIRCRRDRKSTRLNSSHEWISYAVFCLKKKKQGREPALIYCSITGFGRGAGAALAAYDLLVNELVGLLSLTGESGREPRRVGVDMDAV